MYPLDINRLKSHLMVLRMKARIKGMERLGRGGQGFGFQNSAELRKTSQNPTQRWSLSIRYLAVSRQSKKQKGTGETNGDSHTVQSRQMNWSVKPGLANNLCKPLAEQLADQRVVLLVFPGSLLGGHRWLEAIPLRLFFAFFLQRPPLHTWMGRCLQNRHRIAQPIS